MDVIIVLLRNSMFVKGSLRFVSIYVEIMFSILLLDNNAIMVILKLLMDVLMIVLLHLGGNVQVRKGLLQFVPHFVGMGLCLEINNAMMATLFKAMGVSNAKWKNITLAKDNPLNVSTYVATLFSTPKCWKSVTMETAQWTTDASTIAQSIRVGSVQM